MLNKVLYFLKIRKWDDDFILGNPYTKEQIKMMKTGKLPPSSTIWNSWYHQQVLGRDYPKVKEALDESIQKLGSK